MQVADDPGSPFVEVAPARARPFVMSRAQSTFAPEERPRLMQLELQRMSQAAARYAEVSALLLPAAQRNEEAVVSALGAHSARADAAPRMPYFGGLRFASDAGNERPARDASPADPAAQAESP